MAGTSQAACQFPFLLAPCLLSAWCPQEDATVSLTSGIGPRSLNNSSSLLWEHTAKQTPLKAFSLLFVSNLPDWPRPLHTFLVSRWVRCQSLADWKGRLRLAALLTSRTFPSSKERFVSICLEQSDSWEWGKDGCSRARSGVCFVCLSTCLKARMDLTSRKR